MLLCAYSLAGFLFDQPCKILTRATVWDCFVVLQQAVIFVDNAGSDVVLGILPLARELLRRGTTVWVLCSLHFFLCCFSSILLCLYLATNRVFILGLQVL